MGDIRGYQEEGAVFRVQVIRRDDKDDCDPELLHWGHYKEKNLEKACKRNGFGRNSGDSIVDLETGFFYTNPKIALERSGHCYEMGMSQLEFCLENCIDEPFY